MVKEMVPVKRKTGVSRKEFVRKYEKEGAHALDLEALPNHQKILAELCSNFAQFPMSEAGRVIFGMEESFFDTSRTVAVFLRQTPS